MCGSAGCCADSKQTQTDSGVGKLMFAPVLSQAHRTHACLSASGPGDGCCVEKTSFPEGASGPTQVLPG